MEAHWWVLIGPVLDKLPKPIKFKGEICCGGHLAIMYGGELFYLRIFVAKPAK